MKVDDVTTSVREAPFDERRDLLILGGPIYQLYLRCRLTVVPLNEAISRLIKLIP